MYSTLHRAALQNVNALQKLTHSSQELVFSKLKFVRLMQDSP